MDYEFAIGKGVWQPDAPIKIADQKLKFTGKWKRMQRTSFSLRFHPKYLQLNGH